MRDLTEHEQAVLKLVSSGLTGKEIADLLAIKHSTEKRHMTNVFKKLAVKNSSQAITEGFRKGYLS
jgi:DNA-binding NarL/FixJ family response regulator